MEKQERTYFVTMTYLQNIMLYLIFPIVFWVQTANLFIYLFFFLRFGRRVWDDDRDIFPKLTMGYFREKKKKACDSHAKLSILQR